VLLLAAASGLWLRGQIAAVQPGAATFPEGQAPQPAGGPETGASATQALPLATLREMEQIQSEVIALRGLQPLGGVRRTLLSSEELRSVIQEDFLQDYGPQEAQGDSLVLSLLGLIPEGFDLQAFYRELLNEQIAGFYDQESKELYVVQGRGFRGPERLVYAHEYTHVLQDQNYKLEEVLGYSDERCDEDTEGCAALQALLEGDASFTELSWFLNYATRSEELEVQRSYQEFSTPVLDSAPVYLREDFTFPYNQGFEFVRQLYDRGGWQAVHQAYTDPPSSTEQILHPERYPADRPEAVELPDLIAVLGTGWELIEQGVLGEWRTYLILAQGLDPAGQVNAAQAAAASEGWAGDHFRVYYQPESGQAALVVRTEWESASEAQEFAAAFRQHAQGRFPNVRMDGEDRLLWGGETLAGEFARQGETTLWVLAPQARLAEALLEESAR
jgi:hypothetical protein